MVRAVEEDARQGVVVILCPALEGMVMALGALNADPQEQLAERAAERLGRVLDRLKIGDGAGIGLAVAGVHGRVRRSIISSS